MKETVEIWFWGVFLEKGIVLSPQRWSLVNEVIAVTISVSPDKYNFYYF